MKKKIAIIGMGYVGRAMWNFFKGHYDLYYFDPNVTQWEDQNCSSISEINECDLGIVCVPTPRSDDGSCNISIVEETIDWLGTPLILLKSTVEVGTTVRLTLTYGKHLVFSPEYVGESTYFTPPPYDFNTSVEKTPFFIFGGDPRDTSKMVDYFLPVTGPVKKYIQCTASEAEMAKYMENSFYATKIAFCYEVYEICRRMGIDWNTVRELWLSDPRLNPMHTAVFDENDRPFSGKCLPKDLSALAALARKTGSEANLLDEVLRTNDRLSDIRKKRRESKTVKDVSLLCEDGEKSSD